MVDFDFLFLNLNPCHSSRIRGFNDDADFSNGRHQDSVANLKLAGGLDRRFGSFFGGSFRLLPITACLSATPGH
ncbi:hypothetical protein D3C81_1343560 [compost metagenome]